MKMKKFFMMMFFILLIQSVSFGAVSEDVNVYVRQDVFDAKMEALFNRLHAELNEFKSEIKTEISEIRGDIKALSERVDGNFATLSSRIGGLEASLTNRIDGVNTSLSSRIDDLDKRIDDLRNGFYLALVVFGILLGLPAFNKFYADLKEKKEKIREPQLTIDDVKRLIEENNIMLRSIFEVKKIV